MELDRICSLFEEATELGKSQCAANNLVRPSLSPQDLRFQDRTLTLYHRRG